MYLIGPGRVVSRDPEKPFIAEGAVVTDGGLIADVGAFSVLKKLYPKAEHIDARGGVIMPGLINAHTHFYSGLLRGFSIPGHKPTCHYENLAGKSWRLDRELGFYDVAAAAYSGAINCVRNGITTVFDHHAGYGGVSGSLLVIAGAADEVGLRASLCYDTSCRCGFKSCSAAISENSDFIDYCEAYNNDRIKPMFGLHAPFTLSDLTVSECVRRNNGRVGFHIHVSESIDDSVVCMHNYGKSPIKRLFDLGVLSESSLLIHCVNTNDDELELIRSAGPSVVNCPQSNMSNAVGTAKVLDMLGNGINVGLGTDGFIYDMLETARAFVLAQRSLYGKSYIGAKEASLMLFENNRLIAERSFGKGIGILRPGSPADVIIMDYLPLTRMDETNYDDHILFGMNGGQCRFTMAAGRILMLDGKLVTVKEDEITERITRSADALWKRLAESDKPVWIPSFNILEGSAE